MRLLIVQDCPDLLAQLYAFLEPKGYVLDLVRNGYAALAFAMENEYEAIVLDAELPGIGGPEVCRRLRAELGVQIPVIMLSTRDSLVDKLAAFDSTADDYLVMPSQLLELDVRLRVLVRRTQGNRFSRQRLRFGELLLDLDVYEAYRAGVPLTLTRTGYTLLRALMASAPRIVSRESLAHAVWGGCPPQSDALRTHIHALRRAIDKPFAQALLRTVSGVGYRLALPDGHD